MLENVLERIGDDVHFTTVANGSLGRQVRCTSGLDFVELHSDHLRNYVASIVLGERESIGTICCAMEPENYVAFEGLAKRLKTLGCDIEGDVKHFNQYRCDGGAWSRTIPKGLALSATMRNWECMPGDMPERFLELLPASTGERSDIVMEKAMNIGGCIGAAAAIGLAVGVGLCYPDLPTYWAFGAIPICAAGAVGGILIGNYLTSRFPHKFGVIPMFDEITQQFSDIALRYGKASESYMRSEHDVLLLEQFKQSRTDRDQTFDEAAYLAKCVQCFKGLVITCKDRSYDKVHSACAYILGKNDDAMLAATVSPSLSQDNRAEAPMPIVLKQGVSQGR
jgi:hypothetical protein